MADFNPQIPVSNDPNYLNYSRVVEAPAANTSKEIALKTLGQGIGGVAKIADEYIQGKVKVETTEGVDAIRDITTKTLETATQPQSVIPQPTTDG